MKKVLLIYDQQIPSQSHCRSLYYKGIYPFVSNDLDDAYRLTCYNKFDLIIVDFLGDIDKVKDTLKKIDNVKGNAKVIASVPANTGHLDTELRALGADEVITQAAHSREFFSNLNDSLKVCPHTSWVSGEFCWS